MIFNMSGGGSSSHTDSFFLRIGRNDATISSACIFVNGMFITKANYNNIGGSVDIGDAYEIPFLSTPNVYNGESYNSVIILLSNSYYFDSGAPGTVQYVQNSKIYHFNAVPGETIRLTVSID